MVFVRIQGTWQQSARFKVARGEIYKFSEISKNFDNEFISLICINNKWSERKMFKRRIHNYE